MFTIAVGVFVLSESSSYRFGSLSSMGPGYFPQILAWLLVAMGVFLFVITFISKPSESRLHLPDVIPVLVIGASILSFGLLIEAAGMGPAIFASVFISTFASTNINILRSLLLALLTTLACVVVFVYLLGLPVEVLAL
ncbi:tripartite tricarboxylate transporter TctB family protein [Halomonas sp. HMF6819]|uniref:tripartite tricarboxylate transporter TctB family protein n=1 Tax=Halomonas sp. HMF6819 TaxID=3373085 RepID=UPI00379C218A